MAARMSATGGDRQGIGARIGRAFGARYREVVASIYIYNEYRGYTSLDRVLEAARLCCADQPEFIAQIEKHRRDERKHYVLFKRWFERQGRMPIAVDRGFGHIDRFIRFTFGRTIDELDTQAVLTDPALFERLCRVIVLTEQRGLRQVEELLGNAMIRADPAMHRIFEIVHQDEPDHFLPYRHWLDSRQRPVALWQERLADAAIHKILLFGKLPALFFRAGAPRLAEWPDAEESAAA